MPRKIPPASHEERFAAGVAAEAIRRLLSGELDPGDPITAHVLMSRPRRGVWFTTWPGLPGLTRMGENYAHTLLPGWEYTARELKTEMLEDLDRLAATGERPTQATR